ncbi:unnamed protein product [Ilex paraguariensis]|uniref:Uncharacterized protein n=1 Tax=Ilex paraguariensis TaxID=185542 RepID=A0ABC8UBP3_9AQUA
MIKCLSPGGSSLWEAVQMVVDTIIIHIRWFGVVTGSFPLIYMFQVALPQLRPYFMDCSSCRRRSTGARISFSGGPNEDLQFASGQLSAACRVGIKSNRGSFSCLHTMRRKRFLKTVACMNHCMFLYFIYLWCHLEMFMVFVRLWI